MKIILSLLLFFSPLCAEKYNLAICAIFHDEAKYLPEWIEFHHKQGVEHFYLYNNLSHDDYLEKLSRYIKRDWVTLIDVPEAYQTQEQWNKIQCDAYMNFINYFGKECRWCAFLDIDEFLFSPKKHDLRNVLKEYKEFPGVGVNWIMYGTSNVFKIPDNENITRFLTYRASILHPGNLHIKSIVQPKYVTSCVNPHVFNYKNSALSVNEKMHFIYSHVSNSVSVDKLRINHYWTRDRNYFLHVKIPRRLKWGCNEQEDIENEKALNEIYDPILLFY